MGRLNELLGPGANYSRGVAVQFNLEEQEGVPTMAPELVPTSDIHARPEQWYLHGGVLVQGISQVSAGGAGNHSQCAIGPAQGELMILERIDIFPATAFQCGIFWSSVELTTSTGNLGPRDARTIITAGAGGRHGARIRQQNNTPAADLAFTLYSFGANMVVGTLYQVPLDIVLVWPWTIRVAGLAANVALQTVHWFARVRPGSPRELSIGAV